MLRGAKVHVFHRLDSLDLESECNESWQVNGIITILHYEKVPDEKLKNDYFSRVVHELSE